MFAHLVLLLGLVYKPLTQLFWSQPKPPLMAHSAAADDGGECEDRDEQECHQGLVEALARCHHPLCHLLGIFAA